MGVILRRRFEITGIVQGVGFRPFIYNLAREYALTGAVWNHTSGVTIEAEGETEALNHFAQAVMERLPPLALIDGIISVEIAPTGDTSFIILASESAAFESTPVSPDMATCDDCLRELNNPADRRYGYPFINCTNCGPRFTIIRNLPYDSLQPPWPRSPCALPAKPSITTHPIAVFMLSPMPAQSAAPMWLLKILRAPPRLNEPVPCSRREQSLP
jgi:acylphosphatase